MINEMYLSERKIKSLNNNFGSSAPFNYLELKDFFDDSFIERFIIKLKKEGFVHQDSDLFSFYQSNDLIKSKNRIIKQFYDFLNSKYFKDYLFKITNIKSYGKIDCSGFIYSDSDYLLPHDDRLEKRKIAFVFNLSKDFKKCDGGSLDFFKKNKIVKSIIPYFNTLVIFKVVAGKTFHQVSEIRCNKNRISIAGWFNDK